MKYYPEPLESIILDHKEFGDCSWNKGYLLAHINITS